MNTFTDYDEYIKSKIWRPFTTDKGRNYYKKNDSQMTDYTDPKYKNLYEEILLDYHYRFPKFHPIPYSFPRNLNHDSINQKQKTN